MCWRFVCVHCSNFHSNHVYSQHCRTCALVGETDEMKKYRISPMYLATALHGPITALKFPFQNREPS